MELQLVNRHGDNTLSADKVTSRQQLYPSIVCLQSARPGVDKVKPKELLTFVKINTYNEKIRLVMFSLNMIDYPMYFLSLST